MKKIKTGDKILVPFEVLDVQDTGDYPYFLGYGTARIHASAEMIERFRQETDGEKDSCRTYEDGLAEAWETARQIICSEERGGFSCSELRDIFKTDYVAEIFARFTAAEAAAKIAEWESRQAICVGDLVRAEFGYGVVTNVHRGNCYVLWADGSSGCKDKDSLTKTGRTIDIAGLSDWQRKGVPLSIADEYEQAEDKAAKRRELKERYPKCESLLNFLCCCNAAGEPRPNIQLVINSSKYMRDFIAEYPPDFKISAKCCDYCKKDIAHQVQKDYEMIITGERRDEGGMRSVPRKDNTALCFTETADGQYRLRPLYYVSDSDKAWYKEYYDIRYSDAYEVYGLTRTGCCGCPISYKAVADLEMIRPYEPNVVKAAWNIFGKSYEYRAKYNEYKKKRMEYEKRHKAGQMCLDDFMEDSGNE